MISNVRIGGSVAVVQGMFSNFIGWCMDETIPDVPSDIYIIESVSYTEKESLFGVDFLEWTSNGTYYYLYG